MARVAPMDPTAGPSRLGGPTTTIPPDQIDDVCYPIHLSHRVNLDHLFGHEFVSSLGEPLTPYRIAVYCLVHSLDRDIYEYGVSGEVHATIAAMLYGMLEQKEDLNFRQILRIVQKRVCPAIRVALKNYCNMIRQVLQTEGITFKGLPSLGLRKGLVANKNCLDHYVQRLLSAEKLLTMGQKRRLAQQLKEYVKGERIQEPDRLISLAHTQPNLPRCISTGSHARLWIMQQLHLQQVSPLEVHEKVDAYCGYVAATFKDIPAVHLLLMLRAIHRQDQPTAINELRAYFDYSVLRLQDLLSHVAPHKNRMVTVDQRQVRYAPLLQARLYRLFGDKAMARRLLNETISQAYVNKEMTCLRMALVESAAVEMMPEMRDHSKPAVEREKSKTSGEDELISVPSVANNDLKCHLALMSDDVDARMEGEERRELSSDPKEHEYMVGRAVHLGKLGAAMSMFVKCEVYEKLTEHMTPMQHAIVGAASSSSGPDPLGKSREIADSSMCFMAVARLHAGYTSSAVAQAKSLYEKDFRDNYASRHDTPQKAVCGVTAAFGLATGGKWGEAFELIERLRDRFCPVGANPVCTRIVNGAKALLKFDYHFLQCEFTVAEQYLAEMATAHPMEAVLRRCLLLATTGSHPDALEMLKEARGRVDEGVDVHTGIRMDMQLAVLLARNGEAEQAQELLAKVSKLCESRGLHRMTMMAKRRLSMIQLQYGNAAAAKSALEHMEEEMHSTGGLIERVLYLLTVAMCGYQMKGGQIKDKKEWTAGSSGHLRVLGRARVLAEQLACPPLEKTALAMAAKVLNKGEQFAALALRIKQINETCPANLDWTIM